MHFKDSRSNSLLYFEDTRSKLFMGVLSKKMRKRGRPLMCSEELASTRVKLIQAGVELLTKKGFASAGIEEILSMIQVPKGSFYHYFESKEAFGIVLIKSYFNNFISVLIRDSLKKTSPRLSKRKILYLLQEQI